MFTQYTVRNIGRIICLALLALALIVALPLQAQTNDDNDNDTAVEDFAFEELHTDGQLKFSWETADNEVYDTTSFRFKGGGVTNVWTSSYLTGLSYSDGRTRIQVPALTNDYSGKTFQFSVAVNICTNYNSSGACLSSYRTDPAEIEKTFD